MRRVTIITVVAIALLPFTGANAAQNDSAKYYYSDKSEKADIVVRAGDVDNLKPIGMGESSPVASNATASGKALNRRVELRLPGERQSAK
jgi:hypothetical protein